MSGRRLLYSLPVILLLIVVVAGWFTTDNLGNKARQEIIGESQASVLTLSIYVSATLSENEDAVKSLAGSPRIAPALLSKGSRDIEEANSALDRYSSAFTAISYLADADGMTVASSNRKAPDSFVGKSYSFRPYFKKAAKGQPGRYFALGATSGKRGFYASYPVQDQSGKVVGVVTMKKDIDDIVPFFRNYPLCFLISPDGVIFLSGAPAMVGKSLWPLDKAVREALIASRQFGTKLSEAVLRKEIADSTEVALEGSDYLVTRKVIDSDGWSIVLLAPTDRIRLYRLIGILLTISVSFLIVVFLGIIYATSRSKEALQESERKFRFLFESMTAGFALHEIVRDADGKPIDYRFLQVNPAFEVLTGLVAEDIVGKTALEVMPDLEPFWIERYAKVVTTGESIQFENYAQPLDRHFQVTAYSSEAERFATIIEDITDRKLAEEMLKKSETLLLEMTTQAPGVVFQFYARPNGEMGFHYISDGSERILGQKPDLDGYLERFTELVIPEHRKAFIKSIEKSVNEASEWEYEGMLQKPSGEKIWFSGNATPSPRDNEVVYNGIVSDITERMWAEEALSESEAHYRGLFEHMAEGYAYCRMIFENGEPQDFIYLIVNTAFETLTGLRNVTGKKVSEVIPGIREADPRLFAIYARVSLTGKPEELEIFVEALKMWLSISVYSPEKGCFVTVFDVITERKQAEEALRKSEERFRYVLENVQDAVWSADLSGQFDFLSPVMADIYGRPLSEIIANPASWIETVHPEDLARARSSQDALFRDFHAELEYRIVLPNGTVRWISDRKILLSDEHGEMSRMAGIVSDITDRKRTEEERLELERRLLHGQKLESLGVLAGGIAHDFNNLLAAIIGNLSLVTDDLFELPTVREAIEQATLAAEKAAELTKQMLAYSGKGHFQLKELNLSELVKENAQILKAVISKTVALDLQLGSELPEILVDSSQIQQVVMNLITNASEAIGDQAGSITITTGIDSCNETYLSRSRTAQKPEAGMFVWVEIGDTGCGMDEATQQRLFEPFFTTKFAGRGLGMSAVLGIVQGHGGALIIGSEVGKGSNMRVLLPAVQREAGNLSEDQITIPAVKSDAGQVRQSGTVLVVDDEEMIRVLCDAILSRLGFRVLQAVDGEEAMRIFQAHASVISAVIMDLTMPLMDGATAFKKMLQIKPDVKVILSSGYSEHDVAHNFPGQHPAGFLHKPYQVKALKAELERVLRPREATCASVC